MHTLKCFSFFFVLQHFPILSTYPKRHKKKYCNTIQLTLKFWWLTTMNLYIGINSGSKLNTHQFPMYTSLHLTKCWANSFICLFCLFAVFCNGVVWTLSSLSLLSLFEWFESSDTIDDLSTIFVVPSGLLISMYLLLSVISLTGSIWKWIFDLFIARKAWKRNSDSNVQIKAWISNIDTLSLFLFIISLDFNFDCEWRRVAHCP